MNNENNIEDVDDFKIDENFYFLLVMANEVNKGAPNQLDETTRIDCAVADPALKFTYKYTLTTDFTQDQLNNIKQFLKKQLASQWTPENQLTPIYEMGVEFLYEYRDKNRNILFTLRSKKQ